VSDGVKVESAARCRGFAEANMMNKRIGRIGSTAAAVIGGLALTHRVGAVPAVITGNGNIFELSATSSSTYLRHIPTSSFASTSRRAGALTSGSG
jgi:hypothetical protein